MLGDVVVLARQDRVAEGRNPNDGLLLWAVQLPIGDTPPESAGSLGYLVSGSIAVFDSMGDVRWSFGGLTLQGGISFFFPKTVSDGTMFVYGRPGGGAQSVLYSMQPPVLP
jgi:hypothetical protein